MPVSSALLTSATGRLLIAAPVIDFDNTAFIQLGIFLILIPMLHYMLFKPWLAVQARRAERIDGALETSAKMQREARELGDEYDTRLSRAKDEALEMRSLRRRTGEKEHADQVADARIKAREQLDEARVRIKGEADEAREALGGRVDELAQEITAKVLGRTA